MKGLPQRPFYKGKERMIEHGPRPLSEKGFRDPGFLNVQQESQWVTALT
jgi:hypothetical protein